MIRQKTSRVAFITLFLLMFLVVFTGCGGSPTEEVNTTDETHTDNTQKTYAGVYKFAGEAVIDVEVTNIIIDASVSEGADGNTFTDIVLKENMTDFEGNVFTPGTFEFQFVEFPEQQGLGSWYVYLNDERISGNPKASDSGELYDLSEGDIISVDFWTVATFYKVSD